MNCDVVFDILTRGPFPSGAASDAAVEMHLAGCHECRQLAEALRPAVALFHESLAGAEASDLPHYQGRLVPASFDGALPAQVEQAVCEAEASSAPLPAWRARQARPRSAPMSRRWQVGVCALAAAACLAMTALWAREGGVDHPASRPPIAADSDSELSLLFAGMAPACWSKAAGVHEATERDALLCCARCHSASQPGLASLSQVALIHQACRSCHTLE